MDFQRRLFFTIVDREDGLHNWFTRRQNLPENVLKQKFLI